MKDPVYKLIELTGTSTSSIQSAVDQALINDDLKTLSARISKATPSNFFASGQTYENTQRQTRS